MNHIQSDSIRSPKEGEVWIARAYVKGIKDFMKINEISDITQLEIKND